eukprot:5873358-Prymnesium_polylepis.1
MAAAPPPVPAVPQQASQRPQPLRGDGSTRNKVAEWAPMAAAPPPVLAVPQAFWGRRPFRGDGS